MPGSRLHGWVVTKPLTYWHYLATRTLQVIRFDDCCFSMRIGDMIILNGVFCLKRLTCKAGFVRICEVTCSIEDCACSGQAHPYQISSEYWHQKTPARKRSRRTVDNCGTSRCIWQDGTMRKSWNKGKHIGVRVAAYMKQSHGIETARYPRFRLR